MTIGFRILARQRKADAEIVEAFRGVPVANASDSMSRMTVPFEEMARVLAAAKAKADAEAKTLAATRAGKLDPKTWVDETLRRLGCERL